MKHALELNPRDFSILQQIALTYEALHQYKDMGATLDRVLTMAPKDIPASATRLGGPRGAGRPHTFPQHS